MVIKEVELKKADGIQNKDAQTIVQRTMRFDSEVFFEWKNRKINAKSLMGILAMGLKKGDKIMVIIKGDDEVDAMDEIVSLFDKNLKI